MIPDLSYVVWVIVLVLLLTTLLDHLLLRPMTQVMEQREGAIRSARDLAEASRAKAQAATDELESKTRAARGDVYRQMDEKRREASEHRAQLVADTRSEIERSLAEAKARVQAQASAARAQLEHDADAIATSIVERVLGRNAS
ncbi:MAG TPA: ATP synthase F0 subunit B [Vicinamibacterales bacterium]|nr:ATP synthase F0 subunit B [Vicinamibacterales bacterium]